MVDFPAPVEFPAPIGFPAPLPSPYAGLSLVDRPLFSSGLLPFGEAPTPTGPVSSTSYWANQQQLSMLGGLTGGAVSPSADPRVWTPSEAASQTDKAIARIAQVNPDLAAQLQQQRVGQAGGDSGGGFWSGLKNAVATLAGLPVIHQALDLLSRPAHIIPELLADEEHQGFFGNIAQALAGHSDKTMADVLEKAGVDNPLLRGIFGFGLDVVVDPLTYVTFGLGGLGRATVQATAGRVGLEAALSTERGFAVIDRLAESAGVVGKTVAETRTLAFNDLWSGITGKASRFFERDAADSFIELEDGLRRLNPDAAAGALADMLRGGDADLLNSALASADAAMRAAGTGSVFLGSRTAEALGLPVDRIEEVLARMRQAGTFASDKKLYWEARRAAALEGGLHLRVAIPLTPLRYVSPSLAPAFFGDGPFQGLRRFFAGLSGETRLRKMVEAGDADVSDLMTFWSPRVVENGRKIGGFEALRRDNPALADRLGQGMLHLGNALYTASDQIGRVTAGFANGYTWHLLRGGGLGEYIASSNRRATMSMVSQIEDDVWTLSDDDLLRDVKAAKLLPEKRNQLLPRETQTILHDLYVAGEKAGDPQEVKDSIFSLVNYFGDDAAQAGGVEAAYAARKAALAADVQSGLLNQDQLNAALDVAERQYRDALAAEARLAQNSAKDKVYLGMRLQRRLFEQGRETAERYVGPVSDVRTPLESRAIINPAQADEAQSGAHAVFKQTRFAPTEETAGRLIPGQAGLHHAELLTGATTVSPFRGIDFVETTAAAGGRQAAVTAAHPLLTLDEATLKASPDLLPLAEGNLVYDRIEQQAEQMLDLLSEQSPRAEAKLAERVAKKAPKVLETPEGQAALRRLGYTSPEELTPDMASILLDPVTGAEGRAAKKAGLMTMLAQSEGYDSFLTARVRDDGTIERVTTVFHPDKKIDAELAKKLPPVKELVDNAPFTRRYGGYVPFDVTDAVKDATTPALTIEERRLLHPLSKFHRGEARDALFDKTRSEAEAILRAELADKNILLPDSVRIIETDPMRLTSDYIREVSRRAAQSHTGETSRWLGSLGLTRNSHLGQPVGADQWEAVLLRGDRRLADQLARRGAAATAFADRAARIMAVDVYRLRGRVADMSARLDRAVQRFYSDVNELQDVIQHKTVDVGQEITAHERAFERLQLYLNDPKKYGVEVKRLSDGVYRLDHPAGLVWGVGDVHTTYVAQALDGSVVAKREVTDTGEVFALTREGYKGQKYGSRLLDAHWADRGVRTKAQILAQIRKQTFTPEGAALNLSAVRRNLPAAKAMKQAEGVVAQAERAVQAKVMEAQEAASAAERTIAEMKTRVADVRPAVVDVDASWAGMLPVDIFGTKKMKMPGFMALEMQRALQPFKTVSDLQHHWRRWLSWWKDWATWAVPGFHVRNNYGAAFNNWIGGVDMIQDYKWAGRVRKAAHEVAHIPENEWKWAGKEVPSWFLERHGLTRYFGRGRPVYYEDIANLASKLGLNAAHGRAFAEARIGVEKLDESVRGARWFEKIPVVGKPYIKAMRGAGTLTENLHRTAAFFKGLRDSGGELGSARLFVMMRQGDYQDLSDWEYGAVRDLIPFYKWTRTNLPFQFHTLIENPAKLLNVLKAKDAAWEAAGLDYGEDQYRVPEWMREGFSVPAPGSSRDALELMLLDLPMNDLYMGAHEMVAASLPLVRPVLESYVIGHSLFSGKPLTSKAVPVSNVWGLDTVMNLVGHVLAPLGIGSFNEDGAYTIDEKLQNAIGGTLPMFSRFRDWLYADPDRTGLRAASLFSSILGVGARPVGAAEMSSAELSFYYTQVLPAMEQMRSLGIALPTTDDVEALYGTYQQALTAAGLNPVAPTYST